MGESTLKGGGGLMSAVSQEQDHCGQNGPFPEPNKTTSSRSLIFMFQSKRSHIHNWGLHSLLSIRQLGEHQNCQICQWCPVIRTDDLA